MRFVVWTVVTFSLLWLVKGKIVGFQTIDCKNTFEIFFNFVSCTDSLAIFLQISFLINCDFPSAQRRTIRPKSTLSLLKESLMNI
jgi:hypothetical protein